MPGYKDNKKLGVINLLAGPGVGKSVTATELFARMKKANYKVELVTEFAKDMVWEERHNIFPEQDYISAHQNRSLRRLIAHDIDYAVCDTSLILALMYIPDDFPKSYAPYLVDAFNSYDNINIVLERNPELPYIQAGRNQDLAGAIKKDEELMVFLRQYLTQWYTVKAGLPDTIDSIMSIVKMHDSSKSR